MAKRRSSEAAHIAVGFYYQTVYSLVVLLSAKDGESVSVESIDDICLDGNGTPRLMQLKHSGAPGSLTEKNDGLWNAIENWLNLPDWKDYYFVFVTCDQIPALHDLEQLRPGTHRQTTNCLLDEATRVLTAVGKKRPRKAKRTPDYKRRLPGCNRFLELTPEDRGLFLDHLSIIDGSFQAAEINRAVQDLLPLYPLSIRPCLADRLIEWWDHRVANSLLKQQSRSISKAELLTNLHGIATQLAEDHLPDDYGGKTPPKLEDEIASVMKRQIQLVDGGDSRIVRAALARWRARNQRARWLDETIDLAPELAKFDNELKELWTDRFQPMCHDFARANEAQKKQAGRDLLDWSHNEAHISAPKLRPTWSNPFLVQGTYQQLAEESEVGWHPEYVSMLRSPGHDQNGTTDASV